MNIHNLVPIIENGVVRWKALENFGSDGSPWGMDEWKSSMLLKQEDAFCHARVMALLAREPTAGDFYTIRDGDSMSSIAGSLYNGTERIHRDVPRRRLTAQEHLEIGRMVHKHLEEGLRVNLRVEEGPHGLRHTFAKADVALPGATVDGTPIHRCYDCGDAWIDPPGETTIHSCPQGREAARRKAIGLPPRPTVGRFGQPPRLPMTWTSSDGRETLLIDLKPTHLVNILRMINRGQDAKGVEVTIELDMCRALNIEAERRGLDGLRIDLDLVQQRREQVRSTVEAAQPTLAEREAVAEKKMLAARTIAQRRTALAELRVVRRQMAHTTNFNAGPGSFAGAAPVKLPQGGI